MDQASEQFATQLINQLNNYLAHAEDAESAIAVYKTANWVISQLEAVKESALNLAEQDLEEKGLEDIRTIAGSAGWTEPKAPQLNEVAWSQALAADPELRQIQREYDRTEAVLRQAQQPYMELPKPRFFIR